MNQPHALELVRSARLVVQEIEFMLAQSQAESAKENRSLVRQSMFLWAAVLFAGVLILAAMFQV